MKTLITLVMLVASLSSFAAGYTCEAYCGYYNEVIIGTYTDTKGQYVAADGSSPSAAFNEMKSQCRSIDSKYGLYRDPSYTVWATPSNSCQAY